jgi:SOS-response transcriptional repressor LexA
MASPEIMRERIRQRLDEMSLTANAASLQAGLDRSILRKFLAGKVQELRDNNVRAIAKVLRRDPNWLRGENVAPEAAAVDEGESFVPAPTDVRIVGIVEAGALRPADWNNVDLGYVHNGHDPNFASEDQFAFIVRGDQMDRGGIEDGDDIICVDPWDVRVQIGNGDYVVLERKMAGPDGDVRELTVRELVVHKDHYEFAARSAPGKIRSVTVPLDADLVEGDIRIVGIVTSIIRRRPVKLGVRGALRAPRDPGSDQNGNRGDKQTAAQNDRPSGFRQKAAGLAMALCFCWMASASVVSHHSDVVEHAYFADHIHTEY